MLLRDLEDLVKGFTISDVFTKREFIERGGGANFTKWVSGDLFWDISRICFGDFSRFFSDAGDWASGEEGREEVPRGEDTGEGRERRRGVEGVGGRTREISWRNLMTRRRENMWLRGRERRMSFITFSFCFSGVTARDM